MLDPALLRSKFDAGLPYSDYVATGKPEHQPNWHAFHEGTALTDAQRELVSAFTREVNALVVSGTWCGDCVQQLPFLDHIERANPERVRVRFVDRDEHMDLAERLTICSGTRVPVCVLMNEDFDFLALVGDRTLNRYRAMAAKQLGGACPLPGASLDAGEVASTRQDWVDAVERAHLICRLSTKLRQRHGD